MKKLFINLLNFISICGFIPCLMAFYVLQGWQAGAIAAAYVVVLVGAVLISDE